MPFANCNFIDHALRVENVLSHYRESDEKSLDFLYTSKVMVV